MKSSLHLSSVLINRMLPSYESARLIVGHGHQTRQYRFILDKLSQLSFPVK